MLKRQYKVMHRVGNVSEQLLQLTYHTVSLEFTGDHNYMPHATQTNKQTQINKCLNIKHQYVNQNLQMICAQTTGICLILI